MANVCHLTVDEVDLVSGGADQEVIAAGAGIMLGGAQIGVAAPPIAGAIMTIGLAVVVVGVLFD